MILIRFALHLAVQGHLLENGRFPSPPTRLQFLLRHSPSINSVNLKKAGMASRNSQLLWSAKSRSLTDYRKVDQNNVYCFSYCFFLSFFFFFSIFQLAMGEGGGGGARRFLPGGFIFSWLQVSIKGIPQYMTGREFRRLGFFKDLWLIFSEMHIMAVSFLSFLLDKECEGSIVFKNETQTAFINSEIFRFSYDSDILLRSRFLDVTQLQRNVGGTLRDIQKTAGRCINR